jgi:V8-like Glu-specific endopeptidase
MTSSLPLLATVSLVAGLLSAPMIGATATEHRQQAASTLAQPVQPAGKASDAIPGASDVVEHLAAPAASDQRRVLGYWTSRRMAGAVPIDLLGTVAGMPVWPIGPVTLPGAMSGRSGRPIGPVTPPGAMSRILGRSTGPAGPPATMAGTRERSAVSIGRRVTPAGGTREHLRRPAARISGARWNAGGSVARTTGRVFLTLAGTDFVCSASSVKGANRDLVVTAGHCVKDGTGAWADNWIFVPGYEGGRQPYGQFTARRMFVAGPWSRSGDDSYDVGMVAVNQRNGNHLHDAVGSQDITFGTARGRHTYGFGFPADSPYNGEHLVYCAGSLRDDPNDQTSDQGLRCDMTAGSSGGPWLSGFDPVTGRGTLTSVSSFKYSDDRRTMYGPYFGESAKQLYATAQNS